MNATSTRFEVKDVRQVMDFNVFESALLYVGHGLDAHKNSV